MRVMPVTIRPALARGLIVTNLKKDAKVVFTLAFFSPYAMIFLYRTLKKGRRDHGEGKATRTKAGTARTIGVGETEKAIRRNERTEVLAHCLGDGHCRAVVLEYGKPVVQHVRVREDFGRREHRLVHGHRQRHRHDDFHLRVWHDVGQEGQT